MLTFFGLKHIAGYFNLDPLVPWQQKGKTQKFEQNAET